MGTGTRGGGCRGTIRFCHDIRGGSLGIARNQGRTRGRSWITSEVGSGHFPNRWIKKPVEQALQERVGKIVTVD